MRAVPSHFQLADKVSKWEISVKAFESWVIGFEILTAPFAIAQLQLYIRCYYT